MKSTVKKIVNLALLLAYVLFPSPWVFAQDTGADVPAQVEVAAPADATEVLTVVGAEPTVAEWSDLVKSLGGLQGASGLAVAAIVIQLLMYILRSKLGAWAGPYRLLAVYFLSLVGGIIAMRMAGVDLLAALLHANTLAAFQVFSHQVIKQVKEAGIKLPKPPAAA